MAKKLWGGRFSKKIDPNFEKFSQSIGFDHKLAYYDLWGSIFHLEVLHKCGLNILSDQEYTSLKRELYAILRNTNKNKPNKFKYNKKSEDIHTEIQNRLEKKWGKVALKLHTFRSRNDQVVFDVKMYCKWESVYIRKVLLARLCFEIRRASEKYTKVWIPGYTHMQHAQPILLKNYLMAYHKMLSRDSKRLESADKNIDLYLGSGALSGVPISESYNKLTQLTKKFSKELKCNISINSPANTIDNVSDRDFVIEILNTLAILQMHLSRLAEDFILWSTSEFGFIELGDEFCTGSSLMPQKKNPDSLELIRGNTGRIYGNLVSVLTMMKGLPLAYNRDMQMDKEPLFDSVEIIKTELHVLTKLLPTIKLNKANIKKQLEDESLYATDLANYLVKNKVPFRNAHEIVGKMIKESLAQDKKIRKMKDRELKKYSPLISEKVIDKIFQ